MYALTGKPALRLDPTEVAGIYWFNLARLRDGEGRGTFQYDSRGRMLNLPCVDLDGARIWGMTLREWWTMCWSVCDPTREYLV